ncbi:DUF4167 domain-containing protein [Oricola sp.]|uniref:DUF4167 domain-containing protein n=1 Tax=Oricola sp. TaxID=1979950 RepID=UPI003BAA66D1
MRPQQQGRRQRNRNSGGNNRRNQNPLSRNYESNGPDVKIRGNAQVIADKYATLARDALSSGDSVMAENYLQHAEHYNRIILAAQAQAQAQREERMQAGESDDSDSENTSDEQEARGGDRQRERKARANGDDGNAPTANGHDAADAPQPVIGETPVEVALEEQEQAATNRSRRSSPRRPRKPRAESEAAEAAPAAEDETGAANDGAATETASAEA